MYSFSQGESSCYKETRWQVLGEQLLFNDYSYYLLFSSAKKTMAGKCSLLVYVYFFLRVKVAVLKSQDGKYKVSSYCKVSIQLGRSNVVIFL